MIRSIMMFSRIPFLHLSPITNPETEVISFQLICNYKDRQFVFCNKKNNEVPGEGVFIKALKQELEGSGLSIKMRGIKFNEIKNEGEIWKLKKNI